MVRILTFCCNAMPIDTTLFGAVRYRVAVALCIMISTVLQAVQLAFIIVQIRNIGIARCRLALLVFAFDVCGMAQCCIAVGMMTAAMLNGIAFASIVIEVRTAVAARGNTLAFHTADGCTH